MRCLCGIFVATTLLVVSFATTRAESDLRCDSLSKQLAMKALDSAALISAQSRAVHKLAAGLFEEGCFDTSSHPASPVEEKLRQLLGLAEQ